MNIQNQGYLSWQMMTERSNQELITKMKTCLHLVKTLKKMVSNWCQLVFTLSFMISKTIKQLKDLKIKFKISMEIHPNWKNKESLLSNYKVWLNQVMFIEEEKNMIMYKTISGVMSIHAKSGPRFLNIDVLGTTRCQKTICLSLLAWRLLCLPRNTTSRWITSTHFITVRMI